MEAVGWAMLEGGLGGALGLGAVIGGADDVFNVLNL